MIDFKYFKRFFKESSLELLIMVVVFTITTFLIHITETSFFERELNVILSLPLFIFPFIGPFMVLNYKNSRKKADVYYSLPIKRETLLITRILVVALIWLITYLVVYFFGTLLSLRYPVIDRPDYGKVFGYMPLGYLLILPLFIFNIFIGNKGNNNIDRIIFIFFYNACLYAIINSITSVIALRIYGPCVFGETIGFTYDQYLEVSTRYNLWLTPLYPLIVFSQLFAIKPEYVSGFLSPLTYNELIIVFIAQYVVAIGLFIALLISEKKEKTERINSPSETLLGYKIIIPSIVFAIFGIFISYPHHFSFSELPITYILILITVIALYFIYKQKAVIKKDAILYSVLVVAFTMFMSLMAV